MEATRAGSLVPGNIALITVGMTWHIDVSWPGVITVVVPPAAVMIVTVIPLRCTGAKNINDVVVVVAPVTRTVDPIIAERVVVVPGESGHAALPLLIASGSSPPSAHVTVVIGVGAAASGGSNNVPR